MSKTAIVLLSTLKTHIPSMLRELGFNLPYDVHYLTSEPLDKVLKKDIDLDLSLLETYEYIIVVGAEVLKHLTGKTGITKYNGTFIDSKFFALVDPSIIAVKPQLKTDIQKAIKYFQDYTHLGLDIEKKNRNLFYIESDEEFLGYYNLIKNSDIIALDIETSGLDFTRDYILGVSICDRDDLAVYVDAEIAYNNKHLLQELIDTKTVVFHNAKFDIQFLENEFELVFKEFEDTLLLHYCLDEQQGTHGLKDLAIKFTDLGDYEAELDEFIKSYCRINKIKLENFSYKYIPIEIMYKYACTDVVVTLSLFNNFMPKVKSNDKLYSCYKNLLIPSTKAILYLEKTGGPVNLKKLDEIITDFMIDIEEAEAEINLFPEVQEFKRRHNKVFNPNSVKQLQEVLFNIAKLKPIKYTATGAPSTDEEVLTNLKHPICEAILDLRKRNKLVGTYLLNIKNGTSKDGRLRSSFNVTGTTSGRLSSSGVLNYQNLPRDKDAKVKNIFTANSGFKIIQCDLSTAEVYVAAALSKDEFLQKAFKDKVDFHSYIAKGIFNLPCEVSEVKKLYPDERQYAKAITFGILYGAGPNKISETAGVSVDTAKIFIRDYFENAYNLKSWINRALDFINTYKFIYSYFGRKRRLPEVDAENKGYASHAARSGLNFLIQSVSSDINILGMVDMINYVKEHNLEKYIRIFATVHDSIVAEVHEDYVDMYIEKLREFLQKDRGVSIPGCPIGVDFEIGNSWGELEKYKK